MQHKRKFSKVGIALLLLIALWRQCAHAIAIKPPYDPEVFCGPAVFYSNAIASSAARCEYGSYNPYPEICMDKFQRVVCLRGPGESCNENKEMRCAEGLVCVCGLCQNCVQGNCYQKLCPRENFIFKRLMKRFERNLLEYSK